MKQDDITVIALRGDHAYDWAFYRKRGEKPLVGGELQVGSDPLPEAITRHRGSPVTFGLPASHLVIRILDLPLTDAEELAGAVALQVDKFSPFPVEQMVFSYETLIREANHTRVLVAAVQQVRVSEATDVFRAAGFPFARLDCTALGSWEVLRQGQQLAQQGREVVLWLSSQEVVVAIHDAGALISLSGLGPPGDMTDAEAAREMAEEVARLVLECESEFGSSGLLSGQLIVSPEMEEGASVCRAELAALDVFSLSQREVPYPSVTEGMALRAVRPDAELLLNLTPQAWRMETDQKRFEKRLFQVALGLLGLWLLLALGGWGYLHWQQARLERLRVEEQRWLVPANAVRRLRLQVNLIDRYRDRTQSALECLREISVLLPEGVDLISFTYRKGDGMELVGEADSGALVLQFNERLNDSVLFGDVRPGTRTRTRQGRHRFSFEIALAGEVTP